VDRLKRAPRALQRALPEPAGSTCIDRPVIEHRVAATRTAARFRLRRHRWYARAKLSADPVFAEFAELQRERRQPLLDVGCGLGLLGIYLRERGFDCSYHGFDFEAGKIAEATRAAIGCAALTMEVRDASRGLPEFQGDVALLDVLHYLPAEAQQQLLRDAAARVARGGRLILRNVVRERNWRFRATAMEERFAKALRWTPGAAHFPTLDEIVGPLHAAGLEVQSRTLWGSTPFNSYLVLASPR
jgi:cyclopropane fatty-acyl-phospholipid synthase-like methyltransferase